jgi:hypothetical protein
MFKAWRDAYRAVMAPRSGMDPIYIRCVSIDHNGFWGRENHPNDTHIGQTFRVDSMFTEDPEADNYEDGDEPEDDTSYQVFVVHDDTGKRWEFIGHEVEVL